MRRERLIRSLFWIAAAYDGALGLAFLIAPVAIYNAIGVPLPNHMGYIQFASALLIVFALGFAMVARNPRGNRSIILLGIGLKASYCGVVFGHWALGSIPLVWTLFAWTDLAFLLAFVWAWGAVSRLRGAPLGRP